MSDANEELIVVVQVDETVWARSTLRYLEEGVWHASDDLKYRIDPPRPEMRMRRHVHIAEPKHTRTKDMQVSWNDDGSRHDAGSFNPNFRKMNAAKQLAHRVLGVGPEVTFESINPMQNLKLIVEALSEGDDASSRALTDAVHLSAKLT